MLIGSISPLPGPPSLLGESPVWQIDAACLWWCDIPGRTLHRHVPASGAHQSWRFETEPASLALRPGGGLLLAMRDGLFDFDPRSGQRHLLAAPPYDPRTERFNDAKTDAQGRFWVSTIYEPREPALAALYCFENGQLTQRETGITVGNGLAFSPDGRSLYWSDTKAHAIDAFDLDPTTGALSARRRYKQFDLRVPGQSLADYGGRPDGAAMDQEGCYWVALFEGAQLQRLSPSGELLTRIELPVRCPTMPCFGGADLQTLYVTTARDKRPAEELAREPWAGSVLQMRVSVPGLAANLALG